MIKVQRIIAPDTRERSWVLFDAEQRPLVAPNQYLSYLPCLGRSPNTVRAYAHHLQAFLKFLSEGAKDWRALTLTQLVCYSTLRTIIVRSVWLNPIATRHSPLPFSG